MKQFPSHRPRSGVQLARRLERAVYRMNPYLMALAIGLAILDLTCLIDIKIAPPRSMAFDAPLQVTTTP